MSAGLPEPEVDDGPLLELRYGRYALPMTQLAIDAGLFRFLADAPADAAATAAFLGTSARAAEALLAVEAAVGLLATSDGGCFALSPRARTYLLPSSPFYRERILEATDTTLLLLKQAFARTDEPETPLAGDTARIAEADVRDFVGRMDALARPAAACLARKPHFRAVRSLLDVGGGSGALSIAIARRNPAIRCTVLDRGPVCAIADEHIARSGVAARVRTLPGNMLTDSWPGGHDAMLFANVFHNWDVATCRLLARKAAAALTPGGRILLHEIPLADRRDGPLAAACLSVAMLLSHRGKQYTVEELRVLLEESGFERVGSEPSFGDYHLMSGRSPAA